MKSLLLRLSSLLLLSAAIQANAATLNVAASDTFGGGLYNYTYTFSATGGSVDNVFLGSADISPLSLTFSFDSGATSVWSWLGNDTPQDYLQFFTTDGSFLNAGDTLKVAFSSGLAPSSTNFAIALNSGTGAATAQLSNVLAPAAVPEPTSLGLALAAIALLTAGMIVSYVRYEAKSHGDKNNDYPAC